MMFAFRPLEFGDLDVVHAWMNEPHAKPWFGHSRDDVERDYGASLRREEAFRAYIGLCDGDPCGLFTHSVFRDYPEAAKIYGVVDPDAVANLDVLLHARFAHRGLGVAAIHAFLEQILFVDPRTKSVLIDPVPDNSTAIRTYEKAGFRFVRARPDDGEGGPGLYLLDLPRAEFKKRGAPSPSIRPGRDLELAAAIDRDAYRTPFDPDRLRACAENGRLLFAWEGNEPVGFVTLDRTADRPHVDRLAIRRASMRRGLGRMLLLRAMRWAVRDGEIWVSDPMPWLARMGFEIAGDDDDDDDDKAMVCRGEAFARLMDR